MDQFIVSARKYRPATFDTVVGQLSITTTLKNAIKSNHISQAYLFCGPRGVGKTTCARILAKTINCQNISPAIEACNECESCKSFNEQRSYSIHELDAASNNSVEDIRLLIDKVRIPPQIGKYSIFIIDEVHMLSSSAFNAFLKTLEEPPRHAIFILATTEKHKIIPTILSRCQIFDFNRITIQDIAHFLTSIAEKENIACEADALNIIAQKADGAMRDALSIFDQVVSFSDNQITYKKVIENLNVLDYEYYFRLIDHFCSSNIRESLLIFDEILSDGFDAHNFITGLAKHLRDLFVCQDQVTIPLLEVGAQMRERYIQQASACNDKFIFEALNILNQCDIHFKNARNQRLHVEMALVQLCRIKDKLSGVSQEAVRVASAPLPAPAATQPAAAKPAEPLVAKPSAPNIQQQQPAQQPTQNVNPVVEKPAIKTNRVMPSFSIKNAMKEANTNQNIQQEKEESHESEDDPEKVQTINQELFSKKFQEYLNNLKTENPRMYTTLQQNPVIVDNNITFNMSNSAQVDEFNKIIKPDLINFLRKELGIYRILIQTSVDEYNEKKKIYTDQDKYKFLLSKNPDLGKFQQKMNLDFE
jgi:DNA polymerase III subunit gamma/tau